MGIYGNLPGVRVTVRGAGGGASLYDIGVGRPDEGDGDDGGELSQLVVGPGEEYTIDADKTETYSTTTVGPGGTLIQSPGSSLRTVGEE